MVIEVEEGAPLSRNFFKNNFTGHAQGLHGEHNHDQHAEGQHSHSHQGIFNALGDCQVIIANGMGRRLYDDFLLRGKQVYITGETRIERAVELLIHEKLDHSDDVCCRH
jgi:predicted Fe-Mo cluster-binding NifX family protein